MMGSWFSNISIRKKDGLDIEAVKEAVCGIMAQRNYLPADSEEDADEACAILSLEGSQWFTVCSGALGFEEPEKFSRLGLPVSKTLNTDVLGISCFDSDYIYLNLLNAAEKVDAWAGVGVAAVTDITRRTNLPKWESKVANLELFKKAVKDKYVFAEEVLGEVEPCLGLPKEQSRCEPDLVDELAPEGTVQYLHFKLSDKPSASEEKQVRIEKPRLNLEIEGDWGKPCAPETKSTLYLKNEGGGAKGLSIYFIGPYVKNDEITFSDTVLWRWKGDNLESHPVELQKTCMPDGKWAYYYHDPDYEILPKLGAIDRRLPLKQQLQMDRDQYIIFTFVPHGNGRKALDVTIVFAPDENPEGKANWNVWKDRGFKSKKAYFDFYNAIPNGLGFWKPRREDFD